MTPAPLHGYLPKLQEIVAKEQKTWFEEAKKQPSQFAIKKRVSFGKKRCSFLITKEKKIYLLLGKWGRLLGEGSYKKGQEAIDLTTGERVAYLRSKLDNETNTDMAKGELSIAKNLNHLAEKGLEGLPKLYSHHYYRAKNSSCKKMAFLSKLIPNGCFWNRDFNCFSPKKRADIAKKLTATVTKLHKKGVAHGDMHQGNLMLNEKSDPVIIDFGFCSSDKEAFFDDTEKLKEALYRVLPKEVVCAQNWDSLQSTPKISARVNKIFKEICAAPAA